METKAEGVALVSVSFQRESNQQLTLDSEHMFRLAQRDSPCQGSEDGNQLVTAAKHLFFSRLMFLI